MRKSSIEAAIEAARRMADRSGEIAFVISIDNGDGSRRFSAVDEEFIDSEEFDAFDGRIIEEIEDSRSMCIQFDASPE